LTYQEPKEGTDADKMERMRVDLKDYPKFKLHIHNFSEQTVKQLLCIKNEFADKIHDAVYI